MTEEEKIQLAEKVLEYNRFCICVTFNEISFCHYKASVLEMFRDSLFNFLKDNPDLTSKNVHTLNIGEYWFHNSNEHNHLSLERKYFLKAYIQKQESLIKIRKQNEK